VSDFALTPDGDLEITHGRARVVRGVEAISQRLRIRFRLWRGDWFLNTLEGIPYNEIVLRKRTSPGLRREVFRRAALRMHGIRDVLSMDVAIDGRTRALSVRAELLLEDLTTLPFVETPPLFDFGATPPEGTDE
jgi:hypothetical protein